MSVDGPRRRTQRTNCPSAAKAASRKAAHGASERRARQSAEPTCSELSGVIPSSRGLPRVLEQRAKAHVERSLPSLGLAVCGTGRATNSRRRAPRPGRRGVGGFRTRAPNRGRHSRSSGPEKCEKKWEFSGSCPCTLETCAWNNNERRTNHAPTPAVHRASCWPDKVVSLLAAASRASTLMALPGVRRNTCADRQGPSRRAASHVRSRWRISDRNSPAAETQRRSHWTRPVPPNMPSTTGRTRDGCAVTWLLSQLANATTLSSGVYFDDSRTQEARKDSTAYFAGKWLSCNARRAEKPPTPAALVVRFALQDRNKLGHANSKLGHLFHEIRRRSCRSPKGVAASSRSETAPIVAPKGAGDKYFSPGRCSTITGLTAICSCADKWCPGRLLHTNANRLRQNISLLFADGLLPERRK
ncbi:hypothetical protein HPB51_011377 [Rhipicephalus microplus]|uniref:Uncharacterized protein n=1 Tax=Rhipicephalus microplus TaxID=6941 RepID=A0A9J6D9X0_RHIMP|nr:hypothetical protein HPB51_011377 [Rhipicephalus microplus]